MECPAQDRRAMQPVTNTTQNIIGTYLLSISDISEVPVQMPKDIKRQYPQPVHHADVWQAI